MNKKNKILLNAAIIIVCILLIGLPFSSVATSNPSLNANTLLSLSELELTPHAPIYIDGNGDFIVGENGVLSGDGSQGNPFVISGWDIDAATAHGIHILNTDVYFKIEECYIHDGTESGDEWLYYGIVLENVKNGVVNKINSTRNIRGLDLKGLCEYITIANSSFYKNNNVGISSGFECSFIHIINNTISRQLPFRRVASAGLATYMHDSIVERNTISYYYFGIVSGCWTGPGDIRTTNNTYVNNTISYNEGNGFLFDSVGYNTIKGNIIIHNGYNPDPNSQDNQDTHGGLWLSCWEFHVDVIDNTISFNYGRGLLFSSAEKCKVLNNTITQNYGDGLLLRVCKDSLVSNNTIAHNTKNGIKIGDETQPYPAWRVNISHNVIRDNNEYGFYSNYTHPLFSGNLIHHNNFINNIMGNAYDETENINIWDDNESEGNYWDDYTGIDSGGDGIGDTPYDISGGDNQDRYPLMSSTALITSTNGPYQGEINEDIEFYGTVSGCGIPPYTWHWDFGDGNTSDLQNPIYNYSVADTYTVTLTVTDSTIPPNEVTDTTTATIIDGNDNEPPTIKITKPEKALYISNNKIIPLFTPLIFGGIDITVDATDDESEIERVEFFIDGVSKINDTTVPFSFIWDEKAFLKHKHTIRVVAYDQAGNNASDEIIVWKFF